MVTLQEYEAQKFSSAFKQDPIGCRSRPDAIEARWPFAAHQTGTLAIQRATTRHGGPLTYNKLRALIAGCLEVGGASPITRIAAIWGLTGSIVLSS